VAETRARSEVISVTTTVAPPTLDGLFRRLLARQPNALALADPPDKSRVTGQQPRRLTFAQADQAISALAAHFVQAGLPANSVIGVQLPNTVEFALTVLAACRAGLVAALLPQLWRQAELTAALNRTGARAMVTASRIDGVSHADLAMNAAVEAFSIRHVCGFGGELPEGMTSLDEVIASGPGATPPAVQDGRRAAIVSFDVTAEGLRAVPRTHLHLIAGGLAISLEAGVPQGAAVLSALAPSSFAGITSSLVLWLLSGGALALHHPFDDRVLEQQIHELSRDVLVAPAPLTQRLARGMLSRPTAPRQVLGLWRAPEQVAFSDAWPLEHATLTDVYLFGEAGLLAARRDDAGMPAAMRAGPQTSPRNAVAGSVTGEILLTPKGTLALRGPMVPVAAYTTSTASTNSPVAQPPPDHVDTGFAARIERTTAALSITAPPSGIMAVGGYRFLAQDLEAWAKRLGQGALLTALPDRISGHRLAGRAQDNARAREAMLELGLNPLMAEAFRDSRSSTG
jgi:AMP-binding enzyme